MDAKREQRIREIVTTLNAKGKGIPQSVSQLQPFPEPTYAQLQAGCHARRYTLYKHSFYYDASLFGLLGTGGQKLQSNLGMLLTFAGPIAAIAAGFFFSWWWLLAVPVAFFMGMSMNRNGYQTAIFLAALESEAAFCLLYFYGQIGVNDMTTGRGYYWNEETKSSAVN